MSPSTVMVSTNGISKSNGLLASLQKDGFVKIPSLISPELLLKLQEASKHVIRTARAGSWPYVRTVPKQYPPWPSNAPGTNIWGVQHLLHPDMPGRSAFASLYFSSEILDVVRQLVGLPVADADATDDGLVMELFNLLVSPGESMDFQLCWHRDDVKPNVTPEEELEQLSQKAPGGKQLHAQYNLALTHDASLIVVPGSHRRVRTEAERSADPYEMFLPGQIIVSLEPGDAVFYDSNILHRGVYEGIDAAKEVGRMTLHGSVGLAGHGDERARQVLQHGVGSWIRNDDAAFDLVGPAGQRAEGMRKRLIEMGSGEGLGYSLEG